MTIDPPPGRLSQRSKVLHKCCTNQPPERPKMPRNTPEASIFHSNIHKAESFRNRQVIGSSPIAGFTKTLGSVRET